MITTFLAQSHFTSIRISTVMIAHYTEQYLQITKQWLHNTMILAS